MAARRSRLRGWRRFPPRQIAGRFHAALRRRSGVRRLPRAYASSGVQVARWSTGNPAPISRKPSRNIDRVSQFALAPRQALARAAWICRRQTAPHRRVTGHRHGGAQTLEGPTSNVYGAGEWRAPADRGDGDEQRRRLERRVRHGLPGRSPISRPLLVRPCAREAMRTIMRSRRPIVAAAPSRC